MNVLPGSESIIRKRKPNVNSKPLTVHTGSANDLRGAPLSALLGSTAVQYFLSPMQKTFDLASASVFSPKSWEDGDYYASVAFLNQELLGDQQQRACTSPFRTAVEYSSAPEPQPVVKGRCWACWEQDETQHSPLIRACTGCKDPDLQWIHQTCINKFINNLPEQWVDNLEAIAPADFHPSMQCPQTRCARCNEPYRISYTAIPPLKVLWDDVALRYALIVMAFCLLVSSGCAVLLLYFDIRHYYYPHIYDKVELQVSFLANNGITVSHVAVFILIFCHSVNFLTWYFLLSYSSSYYVKTVHSVLK